MEAEGFSDTLVLLYQTTQHQTPQDSKFRGTLGLTRCISSLHDAIIHRRVLIKVCVMLCCSLFVSEQKLIASSCLSLTWESAQINSCGAMGLL